VKALQFAPSPFLASCCSGQFFLSYKSNSLKESKRDHAIQISRQAGVLCERALTNSCVFWGIYLLTIDFAFAYPPGSLPGFSRKSEGVKWNQLPLGK
jgi:hypothetical protein